MEIKLSFKRAPAIVVRDNAVILMSAVPYKYIGATIEQYMREYNETTIEEVKVIGVLHVLDVLYTIEDLKLKRI